MEEVGLGRAAGGAAAATTTLEAWAGAVAARARAADAWALAAVAVVTAAVAVLEACTEQIDNLVLPVVYTGALLLAQAAGSDLPV